MTPVIDPAEDQSRLLDVCWFPSVSVPPGPFILSSRHAAPIQRFSNLRLSTSWDLHKVAGLMSDRTTELTFRISPVRIYRVNFWMFPPPEFPNCIHLQALFPWRSLPTAATPGRQITSPTRTLGCERCSINQSVCRACTAQPCPRCKN